MHSRTQLLENEMNADNLDMLENVAHFLDGCRYQWVQAHTVMKPELGEFEECYPFVLYVEVVFNKLSNKDLKTAGYLQQEYYKKVEPEVFHSIEELDPDRKVRSVNLTFINACVDQSRVFIWVPFNVIAKTKDQASKKRDSLFKFLNKEFSKLQIVDCLKELDFDQCVKNRIPNELFGVKVNTEDGVMESVEKWSDKVKIKGVTFSLRRIELFIKRLGIIRYGIVFALGFIAGFWLLN